MNAETLRTVWLSRNSLLAVFLGIPLWVIAGLAWGLFMTLFMNGSLFGWLIAGLFWGACMWLFFSILALVLLRDMVVRMSISIHAPLDQQLAEALKRLRYTVERGSPSTYVCKPKSWLPRLLEMNRLYVKVLDDKVELTGPAMIVKRVRKRLLRF